MNKSLNLDSAIERDSVQSLRFKFGKNWQQFLQILNETRLSEAMLSLQKMLGLDSLAGLSFLDVGCGSGIFSLAAKKLGAEVFSFDYDPDSVKCAKTLKDQFYKNDPLWRIEQGDILSQSYIEKLGKFDIVYSWGVLHHTGNMNLALNNVSSAVKMDGKLFISIYNDQGNTSDHWTLIKKWYNQSPKFLKPFLILYTFVRAGWLKVFIRDTILHLSPLRTWTAYGKTSRGMSAWYDLIDWVGGYPFEVAKPEEIFEFYHSRGFQLQSLKTCGGGLGCNEYVFKNSSLHISHSRLS